MNVEHLQWWSNLRHGGMLLDIQRLSSLVPALPESLLSFQQDRLRRELITFQNDPTEKRGPFVAYVLEKACGFISPYGSWSRGSSVASSWTRRGITGEAIRPAHLWLGRNGATVPVFIDNQRRIGLGRGKRACSHVLQWLRQSDYQLAVLTNGYQWRIIFAGLDYDAFCEWDVEQWFTAGETSEEFAGLRALLSPALWTPPEKGKPCPLLAAVNESRKGQADLSLVLGERVRQAAELLIQAHAPALNDHDGELPHQDIYRAAVRMIMRLVVVLFAESREGLLPRDSRVYHSAYSLQGLRDLLERISPHKLHDSYAAYPRVLALLNLICRGSSHEAMLVPAYGGELFAPGGEDDPDGMERALHVFENACFGADIVTDYEVRQILGLLTRTKIKIRQGRSATWVSAPVDFSSLDSEYIGILYEGLLDFELRCAAADEPIIFLAVGNQPALPLSTLEQMDNRAIKNLLEKLKDTSAGDDDEEEGAGENAEEAEEAEAEEDSSEEESEEQEGDDTTDTADEQTTADPRYTLRARAEQWARRACEVGGLVRRPRGRMTPERQMQYEQAINRKARQLVPKVVLPGEWYLVRWGGTRKGSGTFYTRPQLAIPTVHRTLRPLAYDPPAGADGAADTKAPADKWAVKRPEDILKLKVCDPACGSGSFCLAALRFLTNALYESLHVHKRIREHAGRAVLDLVYDEHNEPKLSDESLSCRPEDDGFEVRTKAILRRYVVERCIYGVDLDPLAVELCQLSLWIETLDPRLPLTFLNHKIKVGNSLVGTWFDQFMHYPAMAWDREGGDKNHTNGVHYPKEQRTRAIKEFKKEVKQSLIGFIDGGRLFYPMDLTTVHTGHDAAEGALKEIHGLGITDVDLRAQKYEALRASPEFQRLMDAFNLWCSLWFWPADVLDKIPLPEQFANGEIAEDTWAIARRMADEQRFFHWELEFPDVFNATCGGFDAVMGNPPWDIAKPNSKEFFSAFDPLYRSYGKQEAVQKQTAYFERDAAIEEQWLDYCAYFKAMSNWVKYAGFAFGDRVTHDSNGRPHHDFNLGDRGRSSFETSQRRHDRWKQKREESSGYADADHAFRHQGSADINLYKLFLEQAHALLAEGGRLGLIVPSGLYSDHGTGELRRLFVDECSWEWLFGFENREGIFDIHRSAKFNPVIVAKGGQTQAIRTAFMRRNLADWEEAERISAEYSLEIGRQFTPESRAVLEIMHQNDIAVLERVFGQSLLATDPELGPRQVIFAKGDFDMVGGSKYFAARNVQEAPDIYGRQRILDDQLLLPLYEGRMLGPFELSQKGWVRGRGRSAVWRDISPDERSIEPQWMLTNSDCVQHGHGLAHPRVSFIRVTASTNERTVIASAIPPFPTGFTACQLQPISKHWHHLLELVALLNSFTLDFAARRRVCGLDVAWFHVREFPFPRLSLTPGVLRMAACLNLTHPAVSDGWVALERSVPQDTVIKTAYTKHERLRLRVNLEACVAACYGLDDNDFRWVLDGCDLPLSGLQRSSDISQQLNPKGFWRVDKTGHPEGRLTVLSLVAFHDLHDKIEACGGNVTAGIDAFCNQNDGEGWILPETLRLADYGLGHDDRAKEHQPVRECFGPRFYDWQLAQSPEESWKECHLHAHNLLGDAGYHRLLDEIKGKVQPEDPPAKPAKTNEKTPPEETLFDMGRTDR